MEEDSVLPSFNAQASQNFNSFRSFQLPPILPVERSQSYEALSHLQHTRVFSGYLNRRLSINQPSILIPDFRSPDPCPTVTELSVPLDEGLFESLFPRRFLKPCG